MKPWGGAELRTDDPVPFQTFEQRGGRLLTTAQLLRVLPARTSAAVVLSSTFYPRLQVASYVTIGAHQTALQKLELTYHVQDQSMQERNTTVASTSRFSEMSRVISPLSRRWKLDLLSARPQTGSELEDH
jgi:hypothetical protein